MCGIAGFLGDISLAVLERMAETVRHRGPDEGACQLDDRAPGARAGLGHRRLSIIDLETGDQPIWNEDRTLAIVYNGEIYNYRALRERLLAAGHRFATKGDTEVILHAYEELGPGVLDRLEGMFAFGIWDARDRSWFLARDRFGIKPLYHCRVPGGAFAFASEIKPLLPLVGGARVRRAGLYHYLLYGWVSAGEPVFDGIEQLPPAHWMVAREGRTTVERYWSPPSAIVRGRPEAEWYELLRVHLRSAVESHLVADVPVGITLSGGLDSSAVLAMMARAVDPTRIQCFTIAYGRPDDETPYARRVAEHLGVRAIERVISLDDVIVLRQSFVDG